MAVAGAYHHAGGYSGDSGVVSAGPVGPVRPPLHGYSAGVSAGISEHHLVVGTDLPGGVLVMQPRCRNT